MSTRRNWEMSEKQVEGWGFPLNSRKAHYFVVVSSLCGKWMYRGTLEPIGEKSPDDCKVCIRKLGERYRNASTEESGNE